MDCSLPGSSIHGICQARVLEWGAIAFSLPIINSISSFTKNLGEKEWYTHLNAELQRIARKDKKAFLSDQRKEIEEDNRMQKTRDLFKKSRDTKKTFHAKMGTIKDRNGIDLTEAENIKMRWQEYTEL